MIDRPSFSTRRDLLAAGSAVAALAAIPAAAQGGPRRVLWAANVRTKSLDERLTACAAGGFTHMSLFPIDWRTWTQAGLTGAEVRRKLRDAGVRIHVVDPFVQWVPRFEIPPGYPADYRSFIDFSEADILRIAEEVEADGVNCVEGLNRPYPEALLVDALGAFAERASRRGLRVTLEPMPISSIPALADGWSILKAADRPNLGLCFDTWHYFRSGSDADGHALLSSIPAERVFEVQLADALKRPQSPNMTEDLLRFRRLPGDGELDVAAVADVLKRTGAWRSVGPEVFADAMDALDPEEAGRRSGAALDRF